MTDDEREHKQQTRPKTGEPVEIPIPTRDAFLRDLQKVAPPVEPSRPDDDGPEQ